MFSADSIRKTDYIRRDKNYTGLIKVILVDAPALYPIIEKARINHNSLKKVIKDYHNIVCDEYECIEYEEQPPFIKLNYSILAGLIHPYKYSFSTLPENRQELIPSFTPTFGLSVNTYLPRVNERISMEFDAELGKINYFNSWDNVTSVILYEEVSYQSSFARTFVSLKYSFPTGVIRPFFNIGVGRYFYYNQNYHRRQDWYTWYMDEVEEYYIPHFKPMKTLYSGLIKTGASYHINKKYSTFLSLRYDFGRSSIFHRIDQIDQYNNFIIDKIKNISLSVGLTFH